MTRKTLNDYEYVAFQTNSTIAISTTEAITGTLIKATPGVLSGVFCPTTTSTIIKFWDSSSATGKVLIDTFTPAALGMYTFPPIAFDTALYMTTAGTGNITLFYK